MKTIYLIVSIISVCLFLGFELVQGKDDKNEGHGMDFKPELEPIYPQDVPEPDDDDEYNYEPTTEADREAFERGSLKWRIRQAPKQIKEKALSWYHKIKNKIFGIDPNYTPPHSQIRMNDDVLPEPERDDDALYS